MGKPVGVQFLRYTVSWSSARTATCGRSRPSPTRMWMSSTSGRSAAATRTSSAPTNGRCSHASTDTPSLPGEIHLRAERAGGATSRGGDLTIALYAAVLAQACNLGLTRMAEVSDLTYRQLAWATEWYLREETLNAASAEIVTDHHRRWLAQAWGGGNALLLGRPALPGRGAERQRGRPAPLLRPRPRDHGVHSHLRPAHRLRHQGHRGHRPRRHLRPGRLAGQRDRAPGRRAHRRHRRLHRARLRPLRPGRPPVLAPDPGHRRPAPVPK